MVVSDLVQSFHAFLDREDFVDVTLAAGGEYVRAHKLILSICSPYLKELFTANPCKHPIVILKDVAHQELKQLLQFIYRGEVHVCQRELPGLIKAAELLQVRGLTNACEKSKSPPPDFEDSSTSRLQINETPCERMPKYDQTEYMSSLDLTPVLPALIPKERTTRSPLKELMRNTLNKSSNCNNKKTREMDNSDGPNELDFDSDAFHNVLVASDSAKETDWNCKTSGEKCRSCLRIFTHCNSMKMHISDKHDTTEGTLQREPHMYHHHKQATNMAQPGAQSDFGVHNSDIHNLTSNTLPREVKQLGLAVNATVTSEQMKRGWRPFDHRRSPTKNN